jgi:hypothetical protein
MCVIALALGMLVANMLTNVCGCKTRVEGLSFGSDKDATGQAMINAGINEIDARSIQNDSAGDGCMSDDQMCSGPPWTGSLAPDKIDRCFQTRGVGSALGAGGRSSSFYGQFCPEQPPSSCGIGCSTSDDCSGDDGGCNTCMPSGEGGTLTCTRPGITYNPVSGQSQCSDGTTFTPLSDGQTQCTA